MSAHSLSAAGGVAPGPTTEPHTAVTHVTPDTQPKQLKFYEKPVVQKNGVGALILTYVAAAWMTIRKIRNRKQPRRSQIFRREGE